MRRKERMTKMEDNKRTGEIGGSSNDSVVLLYMTALKADKE